MRSRSDQIFAVLNLPGDAHTEFAFCAWEPAAPLPLVRVNCPRRDTSRVPENRLQRGAPPVFFGPIRSSPPDTPEEPTFDQAGCGVGTSRRNVCEAHLSSARYGLGPAGAVDPARQAHEPRDRMGAAPSGSNDKKALVGECPASAINEARARSEVRTKLVAVTSPSGQPRTRGRPQPPPRSRRIRSSRLPRRGGFP